jgi:hypothetical protein
MVASGFSNYVLFPNTDITVDANYLQYPYQGPGGALLSTDTLMTLCEDPAQGGQCGRFNSAGAFKTWAANVARQSYISNVTCGANAKLTISAGTVLSPPGTSYLVCTAASGSSVDAVYTTMAAFNLPPFLIEQACDQNPACSAFMADSVGTQGWLLALAPSSQGAQASAAFVRLPWSPPPAPSPLPSAPWAMQGHDAQHTGRSPYVGPSGPVVQATWNYTSLLQSRHRRRRHGVRRVGRQQRVCAGRRVGGPEVEVHHWRQG